MAERWLNDLNYGHPGEAAYDLKNGEWTFVRQHPTKELKQINSWTNSLPTSTQVLPAPTQSLTSQISTNATRAYKELQRLVHEYPQLAPASDLVPGLALASAAILSTTSVYDPLVGNLFSVGSIISGGKRSISRRVAAVPAGEARNVLRLTSFVKERHGWGFDKSVWLEGPSLVGGESGYWNEEAAPIQQVYFSPSEEKSSFLAVRLHTKTVFFRPICHQRQQPACQSPHYEIPSSVVDAHPILSVGVEQSGGAAHADVTFNPDFQFQCGIVDQQNTWSVWDIDYARKGNTYSISRLVQGHIVPPEDLKQVGEDGWARILWVGDVNTLLVCNRRHLSIVSIQGGSYDYLAAPSLFTQRSSEWILDVKSHPRQRDRFFILTSTRLFLIAVTTPSEAMHATATEAGAAVVLSWRHYRGSDDFTLQLSVQMLEDDEISVILYSHVNDLIQMYIFRQHASNGIALMSCSDPIVVKLTIGEGGHIAQLHMEPLHFGERGKQSHNAGPGHSYIQNDLKFYRVFATLSNLSVHQAIVHIHEYGTDRLNQYEIVVDDITWSTVLRPRKELRALSEFDETDEYIVADESKTMKVLTLKQPWHAPLWTQVQDQGSLHSTRGYEPLYGALIQNSFHEETLFGPIDMSTVTSQLKQMLVGDATSSTMPLGTLMEFAGLKVNVSDIDEASSELHDLFSSEHWQTPVKIWRIASMYVLSLTEDGGTTIASLYDSILQNWIGSLPPDVPIRVRQHKERLARRIAAEVTLASTRVQYMESIMESQPSQRHVNGMVLPILPSIPMDCNLPQRPFSQPSSSMLHSSSQPQSSPGTPSLARLSSSDPLTRLGKYLHISHPSTSFPQNVNQLLAHWQPGVDPHMYDWDATERTLQPETFTEVSVEQQEKIRKRQERREKRQKREDELLKAKAVSQPDVIGMPTIFPKSSPGPTFGSSSQFPLSSQVATQNQRAFGGFGTTPQSQVEPGKFGGRPEKKKKKGKGRVSGF